MTERAWASARGSKRSFAPPLGNWDLEPRITSKPEVRSVILIKLI